MQTTIEDGFLKVKAETKAEAEALQALYPPHGACCQWCGQMETKLWVDVTVLHPDPHKEVH